MKCKKKEGGGRQKKDTSFYTITILFNMAASQNKTYIFTFDLLYLATHCEKATTGAAVVA